MTDKLTVAIISPIPLEPPVTKTTYSTRLGKGVFYALKVSFTLFSTLNKFV
jgi:hypothetical protein